MTVNQYFKVIIFATFLMLPFLFSGCGRDHESRPEAAIRAYKEASDTVDSIRQKDLEREKMIR